MTGWRVIVPIKRPAERKRRLLGSLDEDARTALSEAMLRQVLGAVADSALVASVAVLSAERPERWSGEWMIDLGRGLNAELRAAADRVAGRLLVIHADLPSIATEDIDALLAAAADCGTAIAPDRHGLGTNAIALQASRGFSFAFGRGSLGRHVLAAGSRAQIVSRSGLALDVDTPDDLAVAMKAGSIQGLDCRVG